MRERNRIDWTSARRRLEDAERQLASGDRDQARFERLLAERAQAFAKRARTRNSKSTGRAALVVRVGPAEYAVPIDPVREVVAVTNVTSVPLGPPALAGVVNVRGTVCSVVSLASILGVESTGDAAHAVMVRGPLGPTGLLVDALESIASYQDEEIHPCAAGRYIQGMVNGRIGLIDVDALFAHAVFRLGDRDG